MRLAAAINRIIVRAGRDSVGGTRMPRGNFPNQKVAAVAFIRFCIYDSEAVPPLNNLNDLSLLIDYK